MSTPNSTSTCLHCERRIVQVPDGTWIDPEAPEDSDDAIWRETCDAHDSFTADHEPTVVERHEAKPGDTIPNGATVLQVKTKPHVDLLYAVLLCLWVQGDHREFVTWVGDYDGQRTGNGHYHGQDLAAALQDFNER